MYFIGSLCISDAIKKPWILTCFVSCVLSLLSILTIPYIFDFTLNYGVLVKQEFSHALFAVDFFLAYCITELILPIFDSSYKLSILEGYIHHLFYAFMLIIFKQYNYCNAFWIFLTCEIPTFVKSIGKLVPYFKNPILFKDTFILFRIGIFTSIIYRFFTTVESELIIYTAPPALLIYSLHIVWGLKLQNKLHGRL